MARKSTTSITSVLTDIENHPLKHLVPPKHRLDSYVSRNIGGVADLDILHSALNARHNVGISGPTGCAKTTVCYAFGHKYGLPVFSVPCNGAADPTFLFGGYRPNADGTFTLRPGPLYYICKYGGLGLLDELNMLPPRIGAMMHGPLDSRRILIIPDFDGSTDVDACGNPIESIIRLHPMAMFVATWNPNYSGTYAMNAATLNRFGHKLRFDYSRDIEDSLCESDELLTMATKLRQSAAAGTLRTPVSTNMLIEFEEFAKTEGLGVAYAVENFISAFAEDEQPVVREVIKQHVASIAAELDDGDTELDDDGIDDEDIEDFEEDK